MKNVKKNVKSEGSDIFDCSNTNLRHLGEILLSQGKNFGSAEKAGA